VLVCWPLFHYTGPSLRDRCFDETTSFSEGWHLSDGTSVDIGKLAKIPGVTPYNEFSIYCTLPEDIEGDDTLNFRSKNIFFKVYIDGELIYEPYLADSPNYTNSSGTGWHYVSLPSDVAGKEIEIRLYTVYSSAKACIDNITIGEAAGAMLDTFKTKLPSFLTCILLMFVGLLLIFADIPINMRTQKNHELRYLGIFAASIALWCLAETNMFQFSIGDQRSIHILSCTTLMLIPIPCVLYLNSAFSLKTKWILPLVCILSITQFFVSWILHFANIADIHETMTFTHVVLIIAALTMFVVIFRTMINTRKDIRKNLYHRLRAIGLAAISAATFLDIARYYLSSSTDNAFFVRIGMLVFVICFGFSSLEKTISAVKLGAQSELISQLAYKDGLTSIGNRTAFKEKLEAMEATKYALNGIGIVMFDVNNLKYVNDYLGHHYGDDMLIQSANIIKNSFEGISENCYRIGGDEFAVILSGDNVEEQFIQGEKNFHELIHDFNATSDQHYRLEIAHGFDAYHHRISGSKTLMDIYESADQRMYDNKRALKAQQEAYKEHRTDRL
jgi:diguanylate cyclase (GGDEF)-like protein